MSGFAQVEALTKPELICRGSVSYVGEAKITEPPPDSGKIEWVRQSFRIEAQGAGESVFYSFLYRPEWFQPGFTQDAIGGTEKQIKAQKFLYRRNIACKDAAPFLLAAVGFDTDQYVALAEALQAIPEPESAGTDGDGNPVSGIFSQEYYNAVTDVFKQFTVGNEFGYVLRQASEDTGAVDEQGKKIRLLTEKYEVSEFFPLTDRIIESKRKRAEKSDGGVRFCIE